MIHIDLNQERLRGGQKLPAAVVNRALKVVSRALDQKASVAISVAFISEREMKQLNAHHRGKNAVTDVLSFPLENEDYFGEVLISYEQAERQAKEMRHSTRDEIIFLLVHGLLHVYGFDHETARDAKRMFPLQTRILETLGVDPRL